MDMSGQQSPTSDNANELARADEEVEEEALTGGVSRDESRPQLISARWQAPLPSPNHLAHYKEIQEDFPERILKLTESEAEHRRDYNLRVLAATRWETTLGQVFALIVALAAFAVAAYLAYLGHPTASAFFGAATVGGLVAVFIQGRYHDSGDRGLAAHDPDEGPNDD